MGKLEISDALEAKLLKLAQDNGTTVEQIVAGWVEQASPPNDPNLTPFEQQYRESEALYQSLVDMLPLKLYRINRERKLTFVNHAVLDELGVTLEDCVGKSADDFYPEPLAQQYRLDDERVLKGETIRKIEEHFEPVTGLKQYVEVIKTPLRDFDGTIAGVQGMFWDVTDRIQAEQALRASEERYRIISELSSDYTFVFSITPTGERIFEWISDAFFRLTGYSSEEVRNTLILNMYHEDDREAIEADIARTISGKKTTSICRMLTASGDLKWMKVNRHPIWDENEQRVVRYYGVVHDITAEKQAELATIEQRRLELMLQKEQELNRIRTQLVRTISHEFRTPLAMITTSSDLLERYYERMTISQRQEKLESIRTHIRRLVGMLDDVSLVVRGTYDQEHLHIAPINLEQLCWISVKEVQETIGARHHLRFVNDGNLKLAMVSEEIISRIMINLLSNAVKYSPEGTEIKVELYQDQDDIVLRVCDQGIGISPKDQKRIFEPFFRADDAKKVPGTGLGLSIVKDCVELHGGTITVDSTPNIGTTFTIRLPLSPLNMDEMR